MGQCMSRKAAGAFAASAAVSQNRPRDMQKRQLQIKSPNENDPPKNPPRLQKHQPPDSNRRPQTRGVATSFGFKRRPTASAAAPAPNAAAARRLATAAPSVDGNGNDAVDTDSLTGNAAPPGRSTPKLAPPRKEAGAATKLSRFGFRTAPSTRQNKVADLNGPAGVVYQNRNNNVIKKPIPNSRTVLPTDNNNPRNGMITTDSPQQMGRFTLQSTNLPRPEPIRLIETKTAKTLANNNRRVTGMYQRQPNEETSSKDGSLTEDSGLGSHLGGCLVDGELLRGLDHMDTSPTFGARRRRIGQHKPRTLEVVVTGKKTFDLRDVDDSNDSSDSVNAPPLPQLPSAFHTTSDSKSNSYHPVGLVRERTLEYQGHIDKTNRLRKLSKTSSEGFSDDYGDDEKKPYRDKYKNEKTFLKPTVTHSGFLKSKTNQLKDDSTPPSSDEQEWGQGGEAMADDVSLSFSSSDESKDRQQDEVVPISAAVIGTALQSLMSKSMTNSLSNAADDVKNVILNIEDPTFAAIAAATNTGCLLDNETLLSPSDSVNSFSESSDKKKSHNGSSNSKEINENQSSSNPGTPTNASNSLSLSDGKDDFLIDDEIADQPSLICEDAVTLPNENSTETMVGSTPISKRKAPLAFYGSPVSARSKRFSQNRTGSLDTLSPCESIASDDLMMDFCISQSSGLEDCDGQSSDYPSLNETLKCNESSNVNRSVKDWDVHGVNHLSLEKQKKSTPTRARLLSARSTATPGSPALPESPRIRSSNAAARSPARLARLKDLSAAHAAQTGYDSDDSLRLDKAGHAAVKQDIVSIKAMLLKLRRVLNETSDEDSMRSDTHNSLDNHHLTNGIFNGARADDIDVSAEDNAAQARFELAELSRQVLFLQGQLEDRDRTVRGLQNRVERDEKPRSDDRTTSCNAATQTERIRPISAGPSLLNGSTVDGSTGSLVSVNETSLTYRKSRLPSQADPSKHPPTRLWRQPGEPPSPQRYVSHSSSSIPRRAHSRTRTPASTT